MKSIQMIKIYNHIFEEGVTSILCSQASLDPHLLNLEQDSRLGISLLIPVLTDFSDQVNQLKLLESDQYFYPIIDQHITLQVIAAGNNQFKLENHPIKDYISALHVFDLSLYHVHDRHALVSIEIFRGFNKIISHRHKIL